MGQRNLALCHGRVLQGQETDPRHSPQYRADVTEVLVIGAGMSGIACARALQTADVPVRLVDKRAWHRRARCNETRRCRWREHYVRSRCAISRSK
ncbi:NAD(P)-binding protein [Ruegeria sp. HKCCA6837]|uniref:NAD(P)-binding protein n=1 Tax=Ruegeria sp. HKCCA6837 TaxID=2682989 RepID=UPI00352D7CEA